MTNLLSVIPKLFLITIIVEIVSKLIFVGIKILAFGYMVIFIREADIILASWVIRFCVVKSAQFVNHSFIKHNLIEDGPEANPIFSKNLD